MHSTNSKMLVNSTKIAVAAIGLLLTFFTVVRLMLFLSDPLYAHDVTNSGCVIEMTKKLMINASLLSLFIAQHSFMILPPVIELFDRWHIKDLQRSVYVIMTCVVLQLLLSYWQTITNLTLWQLYTPRGMAYWMFIGVHFIAWLVIYVGNICMDLNELLGIKQVYYSIKNLPEPNSFKSKELLKLYESMRHPSATAFLVIFWLVPHMTIDKFILAVILTSYMFIGWKTDEKDYQYQKTQYERKFNHNCRRRSNYCPVR